MYDIFNKCFLVFAGLLVLTPFASYAQSAPTPISIPVLGLEVSNLTENFGDPRSGGRTHEGLDMIAPEWTPVVSPVDAVVTNVSNGASSGLTVRARNTDDESFVYMHLVAFAKGVERGTVLKKGDVLGFVGNTGNASGGGTHLHFEIRKNGATDPYPRLTQVFSLQDQMKSVAQALERSENPNMSTVLVNSLKEEFRLAQSQGIPLPQSILNLLGATVPVVPPPAVSTPALVIFGDSGAAVAHLQGFLIAAKTGEKATYLERSGATGYFGSVTLAALIEYQEKENLTPRGTLDPITYSRVVAFKDDEGASESPPGEGSAFTRDLTIGATGEDVRQLQILLNKKGFLIATSGSGSLGQETTYFGTLTKNALARFQAAYQIAPAVGYFGTITRTRILSL